MAIKYLNEGVMESDPKSVEEFEQEVRCLRGIRHANIVLFWGAGVVEGSAVPFLVLEFMQNGSLQDRLMSVNEPMVWERRLRYMCDAVEALCYIHHVIKPACIHRDIKSPNMLISTQDVLKLSDFGTVRILTRHSRNSNVTAAKSKKGTALPNRVITSEAVIMTTSSGTLLWQAPGKMQ